MDSHEAAKIKHYKSIGRAATDKGPVHYRAWWGGSKGGDAGALGGLAAGMIVGLAIGLLAAGGLAVALPLLGISFGIGAAAATVGAMTVASMWHYVEKYEKVGIVAGAISAAQETGEQRQREYAKAQFQEVKQELSEIKQALHLPEKNTPSLSVAVEEKQREDYPVSHCDDEHCPPGGKKIFWKVAAVCAGVGAVAGLIAGVAGGEQITHLFESIFDHGIKLSATQVAASTAIVGAAAGATLGINRDLFRQIFDVTDHWFKGMLRPEREAEPAPAVAIEKPAPAPLIAQPIALENPPPQKQFAAAFQPPQPQNRLAFQAEPQIKIFIPHIHEPERDSMFFRHQLDVQVMREALFNHDHVGQPGH